MCLAVPGKIVSIDGDMGDVDFGGVTRKANLSMVDANVGDWAVVHAGFAIQIMGRPSGSGTRSSTATSSHTTEPDRAVLARSSLHFFFWILPSFFCLTTVVPWLAATCFA